MSSKKIMPSLSFFSSNEPRPVSEIVADIQNKVMEFDARIEYDQQQLKKTEEQRQEAETEYQQRMAELASTQKAHEESISWAQRVKARMADFIA